jgi:hypothetical protein
LIIDYLWFQNFKLKGVDGPGHFMGQTAVAVPAAAVITDPGNRLFMTPPAIFQNRFGAPVGDPDIFPNLTGIKLKHIRQAVDIFPGQVTRHIVVGKMAIHAFDPAVGPGVPPGFVLRFHDVATRAELRGT